MALTLLAGPANAGKVALLLERYVGALQATAAPAKPARPSNGAASDALVEPFLIVPNRRTSTVSSGSSLALPNALMAGEIGTFDDLFGRLARAGRRTPAGRHDAQRTLIVRGVIARARLNGWTRSGAFSSGFADALSATLGELESGLVRARELEGDLAALCGLPGRARQPRLWDRDLERRAAANGLRASWSVEAGPFFAYGFEDLTGAQWRCLRPSPAARSDRLAAV